jgi:hypothetical protein
MGKASKLIPLENRIIAPKLRGNLLYSLSWFYSMKKTLKFGRLCESGCNKSFAEMRPWFLCVGVRKYPLALACGSLAYGSRTQALAGIPADKP